MRLLHTTQHTFHYRRDEEYCILSHRWSEDTEEEIHYGDALTGHWKEGSYGHTKLMGACRVACSRGYEWIWIDTCCIKKESDAELSEAINSMYIWYAEAALCIAYLSDVPDNDGDTISEKPDPAENVYEQQLDSTADSNHKRQENYAEKDPHGMKKYIPTAMSPEQLKCFRHSSWFTRGWTLQEMLAPRSVDFYSQGFQLIGSKRSLISELTEITGVPEEQLRDPQSIKDACFAQKMSWMSKRITTRKEDASYCMLGILNINMALLYGEGDKAFLRLQREHLSAYDDESIFAWSIEGEADRRIGYGMLAESPAYFQSSSSIRLIPSASSLDRRPYVWTQKGVVVYGRRPGIYHPSIYLACHDLEHDDPLPIAVRLIHTPGTGWRRLQLNRDERELAEGSTSTLRLLQLKMRQSRRVPSLRVSALRSQDKAFTVAQLSPRPLPDDLQRDSKGKSERRFRKLMHVSQATLGKWIAMWLLYLWYAFWISIAIWFLQKLANIILSTSITIQIVLGTLTALVALNAINVTTKLSNFLVTQ